VQMLIFRCVLEHLKTFLKIAPIGKGQDA